MFRGSVIDSEFKGISTIEMLNFLKGPGEVSGFEKQFIKEHLGSETYKVRSYFEGATPQNSYKPDELLTVNKITET